jgi:hypothetical protein
LVYGLLIHVAAPARADDDIIVAEGALVADAGFGQMQGAFIGTYNINAIVGAERFYNAGFTGTSAVMANIEAGYIWSGHETLSHVQQIPTSGGIVGVFDRHATWVAMIMGGRPGGANPGPYQRGIAPDAQFFSAAIAPSWSGTRFTTSFSLSNPGAVFGAYRAAMQNGITGPGGSRTADVVNTSWITGNFTGLDQNAGTFDALAQSNPRTLHVTAAGNPRRTLKANACPNEVWLKTIIRKRWNRPVRHCDVLVEGNWSAVFF